MTWEALSGDTVSYSPSPLESSRFGRTIARLSVGWRVDEQEGAEFVAKAMESSDESLVIARWPTHMFAVAAAATASKRSVLVTDVLTYWEASPDIVLTRTRPPTGRLHVTAAGGELDEAAVVVEDVMRDAFHSYGNHYRANPDLNHDAALAGYVEWAQSNLQHNAADVLLMLDGAQAVGLATLALSTDGDDLEIEVAGVRTSHQGQGLYTHLLNGCAEEARRRSCRRLLISTQVHNARVQRAWARAGMVPFAAHTTAHASLQRPTGGGT